MLTIAALSQADLRAGSLTRHYLYLTFACFKLLSFSFALQVLESTRGTTKSRRQGGGLQLVYDRSQSSVMPVILLRSMRREIITCCLSRGSLIIAVVGRPSDGIMTVGQYLKVVKRDTRAAERDNYGDCISAQVLPGSCLKNHDL